jgi:hypothetical protein
MIEEISSINFKSQIKRVKTYILDTPKKAITRIEYRTFDEGLCDATYFVCPKTDVQNRLEAFVILYNYQLHFHECWMLLDTKVEDLDNIINLWILPQLEKFCFTQLSTDDIRSETQIVDEIEELIFKNIDSSKKHQDPDRWGIYVNGELALSTDKFKLQISDRIKSGIGLYLDWNLIEIFYETVDEYVLFMWSTGA